MHANQVDQGEVLSICDGNDRENFDGMFTKYKARLFENLLRSGEGKAFRARAARHVFSSFVMYVTNYNNIHTHNLLHTPFL